MDKELLKILVCPVTKGPLVYDKEKNELISKSFMKKACEPNEVANLILFLSSKNSQYTNGQIIFLDGGMEC